MLGRVCLQSYREACSWSNNVDNRLTWPIHHLHTRKREVTHARVIHTPEDSSEEGLGDHDDYHGDVKIIIPWATTAKMKQKSET